MTVRIRFVLGLLLATACGPTFGHGGKVDAKGCHPDDRRVVHCHASELELKVGASSAASSVNVTATDVASDDSKYVDCKAVRAAGAAPLSRGSVGYGPHLDADGDGIACE